MSIIYIKIFTLIPFTFQADFHYYELGRRLQMYVREPIKQDEARSNNDKKK